MPLSDTKLIKNLYQLKKYGSQRILAEFSEKNWKRERTGHLTEKDGKQEARTKGTRAVRTGENGVTTVDELIGLY